MHEYIQDADRTRVDDNADWPLIQQVLTFIGEVGGPDIDHLDLGVAPWPCHGPSLLIGIPPTAAGDDFRSRLESYSLEWMVPKFFGTCGGGE